MIPYEDFAEDIELGDRVEIMSELGNFSGEVVSIKNSSVKINDGESEIRIYFEQMSMYKKLIQKSAPKPIQNQPIQPIPQQIQQFQQSQQSQPIQQIQQLQQIQPQIIPQPEKNIEPIIKNQTPERIIPNHGYKILTIDQFKEELSHATKVEGYKGRKKIDSLLASFDYAKKIHEDQLGKTKMDDIISQLKSRISRTPSDRLSVLLLGAIYHYCGRDDLSENVFQHAYKLANEEKNKISDPCYIEANTEFIGRIHVFRSGINPGRAMSWFGFMEGESVAEPKKVVRNLYFNIHQVSDPEFRRLLMTKNFADKKVSFKIGWRKKGDDPFPAADDIRLIRCEGWIRSFAMHSANPDYAGDAGKIVDSKGQLQTFNLSNVMDPFLRAYLQQKGTLTADDEEIQVSYVLRMTRDDRSQVDDIFAKREFSHDEIQALKDAGYLQDTDLTNWEEWKKNNLMNLSDGQKIIDENYKPIPLYVGRLPDEVVNERVFMPQAFEEGYDPWKSYEPGVTANYDPYDVKNYQDWIDNPFDPEETAERIFMSMYDDFRNIFAVTSSSVSKSELDSIIAKVRNRLEPIAEEPMEKAQLMYFDFADSYESFDSFSKKITREERSGFTGNFFVLINSFSGDKIDANGVNFIFDRIEKGHTTFFIVFTREPIDARFEDYFERLKV